jgi:hypothetical protein
LRAVLNDIGVNDGSFLTGTGLIDVSDVLGNDFGADLTALVVCFRKAMRM